MSEKNLKEKAIASVFWKLAERIGAQVVSLVVSIVLARILAPKEYSVVSIVLIFFAFANVLISGGLNTALIQKKNADKEDYSTILFVSVILSLSVYAILFFVAPLIAELYENEDLVLMIRVMGLALPINAVKAVWCAYVSSNLMFRKFFFSTLCGIIFSGGLGVVLALNGAGAWALIAQQLTNVVADTVILVLTTRIQIVPILSLRKLRGLWSYGWKVFVSSILGTIYVQITPLMIGAKFTTENLSFYTRGRSFPELFSSVSTNTLSAVLLPVLSKYQDSKENLLRYTRLYIQISSYIAFPLMLGLFAVSDNFILILLGEKWLPASPFIRIFCLSSMFDMVATGNCETIKAMGRSDIFLIMEIIKKSSYFATIFLFVTFGDSALVLAMAYIACASIALIVNSIPNKTLIGYTFSKQFVDLFPNLAISVLMMMSVFAVDLLNLSPFLGLIVQVLVGGFVYILCSILFKNQSFRYLLSTIKGFRKG